MKQDIKKPAGFTSIDGARIGDKRQAPLEIGPAAAPVKVAGKKPIDKETGFDVDDTLELFDQRFDIFNRANWDDKIKSAKATEFWSAYAMPNARARKADGFSQRDYAMRNAAWHFTKALASLKTESEGRYEGILDTFSLHGPGWPEKWPLESPEASADEIKKVSKIFGADIVGICEYDERWIYSKKFKRLDLSSPEPDVDSSMTHVIVIGTSMDYDLGTTVPSALAATATGSGYTSDTVSLMTIAQYIRNLGYNAYASMNDTGLNIPLAIQAGLGQYGKNGLLITKEYGPRVRIGKIFTDMPLAIDKPVDFGVTEMCNICNLCSEGCPVKAIPFGAPKRKAPNESSFKNIKKWTTNAEKCFKFWTAQNTECSICIRVCPYNRRLDRLRDRAWLWLSNTPLRKLALWLDRYREGGRQKASLWWDPKAKTK